MLKILIVEGNTKESRDMAKATGILTQSALYLQVLKALADDVDCTIVYPTDDDADLPSPPEIVAYDGIAWTGSALNIYEGGPGADRQVDFMKMCLGEDTRIFGSCWGLQVAIVAAGGEVAANVKGREIGIARDIQINEEGLSHPLYRGKQPTFDAVAVHLDHVVRLPEGAKVLSSNSMSQVQALELCHGKSLFWGVQYHPEFDLEYMGRLIRKYEKALIDEGISKDEADVEKWAADFTTVHNDDSRADLKQAYDLGPDVLDFKARLLELSNWLSYLRTVKSKLGTDVQTGT